MGGLTVDLPADEAIALHGLRRDRKGSAAVVLVRPLPARADDHIVPGNRDSVPCLDRDMVAFLQPHVFGDVRAVETLLFPDVVFGLLCGIFHFRPEILPVVKYIFALQIRVEGIQNRTGILRFEGRTQKIVNISQEGIPVFSARHDMVEGIFLIPHLIIDQFR